jgi:transcription elongation factor GreA
MAETDPSRVPLSQPDFDAVVSELDVLRTKHRNEVARRLREARTFGGSTENDDFQAIAEDAAFDLARIAQLEQLLRCASVVDGAAAGDGAGLGSTVRVSDPAGRHSEYVLVGRRDGESDRREVTMGSPVGKALWGARPGDTVTVVLPTGRSRALHVLDVTHASPGGAARAA